MRPPRAVPPPNPFLPWLTGPEFLAVLAALAGALKLITRATNPITEGTIVFIVCDGGWKYLSTGAWTDDLDEVTERASKIIYF